MLSDIPDFLRDKSTRPAKPSNKPSPSPLASPLSVPPFSSADSIGIRTYCPRDRSEILAIDYAACEYDAGPHEPLTDTSLMQMVGRRNVNCLVAVRNRPNEGACEYAPLIIGYAVYELDAARNQIRIVDLAVCPTCRRHGAATMLVGRLADRLGGGWGRLTAMTHERNGAAHRFFGARGFASRLDRGYFEEGYADGYMFTYYAKGMTGA